MKVINLPNRETFRTNNEEAGEFIEKIVRGGEVTLSELHELEGEVKEVLDRFIGWNKVYADKEWGYLYLKEKLENAWKMSGYDMTLEEFIEEFYTVEL